MQRAEARVDLAAIRHNCERLAGELRGGAALCAVVKADGYGHGAVPVARAALDGGAAWLAVASANEAAQLREAGIEARVLVMGALTREELDVALAAGADVVAWREAWLREVLGDRPARVHVKLDTGMGRLGTRDPAEADAVTAAAGERLTGLMTHFATADEPGTDGGFFEAQLERFGAFVEAVRADHSGVADADIPARNRYWITEPCCDWGSSRISPNVSSYWLMFCCSTL